MRLRESRHGNIHVLHLEGEIDLHCAPTLRSLFQAKAACCCPYLVLDLTAVQHIDSTGIAVLIEYLRDATLFDGHFCIAGISDNVRSVFNIIQLHQVIPLFDNIEAAKRAVRSGSPPAPAHQLFGERDGHATLEPDGHIALRKQGEQAA